MKFLSLGIWIASTIVLLASNARSAGLILDSFTENSFSFVNPSSLPVLALTESDVVNLRSLNYSGPGTFFVTQSAPSGIFNFRVDLRGNPNGGIPSYLQFIYVQRNEQIDLLGTSHAYFRVSSLVGAGEVQLAMAGGFESVTIPVSATGDFLIPVPNGFDNSPLQSTGSISIRLVAKSLDFSITLDEIGLIPEPAAGSLVAAGTVLVLAKRRRGGFRLLS